MFALYFCTLQCVLWYVFYQYMYTLMCVLWCMDVMPVYVGAQQRQNSSWDCRQRSGQHQAWAAQDQRNAFLGWEGTVCKSLPPLLLFSPARTMDTDFSFFCVCDYTASVQVVTIQLQVTVLDEDDHGRNHNNRIDRHNSRFFTISSLRRKRSPTHTLKWQHIQSLSQATCRVPLGTKGQLSY